MERGGGDASRAIVFGQGDGFSLLEGTQRRELAEYAIRKVKQRVYVLGRPIALEDDSWENISGMHDR